MTEATALRLAIDLLHAPSRVRQIRAEPLPHGVSGLLRVAAADDNADIEAARSTGRSPETVKRAAAFFIEQVLLCPQADSYRVLGAGPEAATAELRRNMALLLRWLHPDMDQHGHRSVFAARVTSAWDDLKTPERRHAYDLACGAFSVSKSSGWKGRRLARPGVQMAKPRSFGGIPGENRRKLARFLGSRTIVPRDRFYRALLRLFAGYKHR